MTPDRRGAALTVVVVALALLGILAAAGAFATTLRIRGQRDLAHAAADLATAESLATATVTRWRGPLAAHLAAGDTIDVTAPLPDRTAHLRLTPLARGHYVLTTSVDAPDGRRAGLWLALRRDSVRLDPLPAVTGHLVAHDAASTLDVDSPPLGWLDCPPLNDSLAASSPITHAGIDSLTTMLRAHAELPLDASTHTVTLAPRVTAARCDVTSDASWGDPDAHSACGAYRPVVTAPGALTILGGRGQGILIADGDLELRGDAHFVGLVVAYAHVTLADDARITGALLLANDTIAADARDRARIERSTCAVARALAHAAPPRPDGAHAWAPLY